MTGEFGSISELAGLLATKQLSALELTRLHLDRIERYDSKLHSFIAVTADRALFAARGVDAEISSGRSRGLLHGIPFAVKDVYDVEGIPTTAGSRAYIDNVPTRNSTAVARLQAAGAILLGKAATHELTHGGVDTDLPWPPARNPWNIDYDPGGSSSGSGAAVAAGLCTFALGTDTGGSIRKPAGFCGIAGLKPTFGRVSRFGVMLNAKSMDHCGPMARSSRDCAIVLGAMAGLDPLDAASSDAPVSDYPAALTGSIAGIRVGVVSHFWERDLPAKPEMRNGMQAALDVLRTLGAQLKDIELNPVSDFNQAKLDIQRTELHATYGDDIRRRPQLFGAKLRGRMKHYDRVTADEYNKALEAKRTLTEAMLKSMAGLDVLVTAGPGPASRLEDAIARVDLNVADLTLPFSLTGFPVVATCVGFTPDNLPFSMQIVGKPFDEASVLRVADAYERATDWHMRRPAF